MACPSMNHSHGEAHSPTRHCITITIILPHPNHFFCTQAPAFAHHTSTQAQSPLTPPTEAAAKSAKESVVGKSEEAAAEAKEKGHEIKGEAEKKAEVAKGKAKQTAEEAKTKGGDPLPP